MIMNEKVLDRRSVLAAAACAAAAGGMFVMGAKADGAAQVAGGYANPDAIGTPVEPDATEDVDVVVMGSGMGGFTATMLTKEQASGATVVMLEKLDALGGNTNFAEGGGGFINMTPEEARAGVQAEVIQRNFVVDPELFYALRTQQSDCSDWLFGKHGVQIKDYGSGQPLYLDGHGFTAIETLKPQAGMAVVWHSTPGCDPDVRSIIQGSRRLVRRPHSWYLSSWYMVVCGWAGCRRKLWDSSGLRRTRTTLSGSVRWVSHTLTRRTSCIRWWMAP